MPQPVFAVTKFCSAIAVCALLTGAGYTAGAAAAPRTAVAPTRFCSRVGTDDRSRPIPPSLVSAAQHAFGLGAMPASVIRASTSFRCFEHRVLLCTVGANLPCGKADRRTSIPAASEWCIQYPGATSIPEYVVGHATIYDWKCDGARAVTAGTALHVDARGFIAEYWKSLN